MVACEAVDMLCEVRNLGKGIRDINEHNIHAPTSQDGFGHAGWAPHREGTRVLAVTRWHRAILLDMRRYLVFRDIPYPPQDNDASRSLVVAILLGWADNVFGRKLMAIACKPHFLESKMAESPCRVLRLS